jgi:Protein of unknown function (DUF3619)
MTMNEHQFGNRVRQVLNRGLDVSGNTAERLRAARERALARQRPESARVFVWADSVLARMDGWGGLSLRIILPMLLLAGGVAALYVWDQNQRMAELVDIDAQLLSDDLPIDAYLDRGFQNWMSRQRAAEH